jgi:hypothetical protein
MKNCSILVGTLVVLLAVGFAEARYSGGTGESTDPYRIATAQDLNDIGNHQEDWDKHFVLVNDVNLAEYAGTQFNIIGKYIKSNDPNNKPFTGIFNGRGHKIWNFTWNSTNRSHIGLFGWVSKSSEIRNLRMENVMVDITSEIVVGGLVGLNYGTINNCHSTGSVSGRTIVGKLVGYNEGNITDCSSTGNVSAGDFVGGLVGCNRGTITNCYATGNVTCNVTYSSVVGGLVGINYDTITNCYSIGSVLGVWHVGGLVAENWGTITGCHSAVIISGQSSIGGLVGGSYGTITDCYSSGSVTGDYYVGGLVGSNEGPITNCYSTGSVSGDLDVGGLAGTNVGTITDCYTTGIVSGTGTKGQVGGLVGFNWAMINNCYSNATVSGGVVVGGLVGYNGKKITKCYAAGPTYGVSIVGGLVAKGAANQVVDSFWDKEATGQLTSVGGTPKTTAEMKTINTFTAAGWDFIEIWGIGENQTYPFLRFAPAGDFNYDKKIDLFDLAILASHWLEEM